MNRKLEEMRDLLAMPGPDALDTVAGEIVKSDSNVRRFIRKINDKHKMKNMGPKGWAELLARVGIVLLDYTEDEVRRMAQRRREPVVQDSADLQFWTNP
jgi:hypothetical protein